MKNNEIQIAEMKPEDVSAIKKIETASGLSNWKAEDYFNEIEKADSFTKIVSFKNEIIGFIAARLITTETEKNLNTAEIYNIAVKENLRKKGVGGFLLNDFIQHCRKQEISEIWLEVRKSNKAAQEFYSKYGFKNIGERKNYYADPFENAIIMNSILTKNENKNENLKT